MSKKERDRLDVMARVKRKQLTVVEASAMLGLSERQARRVWKRFGAEGAAGLVHGLRGRASNRRFPEEFRALVIKMRQGNALLEEMFLDDLNRRYAVKARRETDLHRRLDAEVVLEEVLCVQELRKVGQDWCVRWHNRWLQIDAAHEALNLAGRRVLVKRRGDGVLVLEYQKRKLIYKEVRSRPVAAKRKITKVNNRKWKPAAGHPWRAGLAGRVVPGVSLAAAAPARDLHPGI